MERRTVPEEGLVERRTVLAVDLEVQHNRLGAMVACHIDLAEEGRRRELAAGGKVNGLAGDTVVGRRTAGRSLVEDTDSALAVVVGRMAEVVGKVSETG